MIFTRYMDMPLTIRGFTVQDNNGDYNIYLNPALSSEQNQITYNHELLHISSGDFFRSDPAHLIEEERKNA